jgi:hypothetical protein
LPPCGLLKTTTLSLAGYPLFVPWRLKNNQVGKSKDAVGGSRSSGRDL